jgi:hypothetical protein
MSKGRNDKRNQILKVVGVVAVLMGAIYGLAIMPLHHGLEVSEEQLGDSESKLAKYEHAIQKSAEIENTEREMAEKLQASEQSLPKGDLYLWMLDNIHTYKERPTLEFDQVDPPRAAESSSLPTLSYQNMAFAISGTAYFHDFGLFLADFENHFPFARIRSLELEPAAAGRPGGDDREKLRFKFEFVTPTKSGSASRIGG